MASRSTLAVAASLGGHLELLEAAAPALIGHDLTWVTSPGAKAEALRARGARVVTLARMDKRTLRPGPVLAGAIRGLRTRADTIVTSGAGVIVPFALSARATGAGLIFIETMARVTSASLAGRVLSRVASDVLVQWPQMKAAYPQATVCRPLLLEGVPAWHAPCGRGSGTFVTLGSHDQGFPRLLAAVEQAAAQGVLPLPIFVQAGASARRSDRLEMVDYLTPAEFVDRTAQASLIITHGGAGAIASALRAGQKPLVMARSAAEHVDDHQSEIVAELAKLGYVSALAPSQPITAEVVATTSVGWPDDPPWRELPSIIEVLPQLLPARSDRELRRGVSVPPRTHRSRAA